jgi:ubiquitin carboxyl-terminal hydrolase L5
LGKTWKILVIIIHNLESFTTGLSPKYKGEQIGNNEIIREAHNSFSIPEPFIFDEKEKEDDSDSEAFHYISYLPFENSLYELDGLKSGKN